MPGSSDFLTGGDNRPTLVFLLTRGESLAETIPDRTETSRAAVCGDEHLDDPTVGQCRGDVAAKCRRPTAGNRPGADEDGDGRRGLATVRNRPSATRRTARASLGLRTRLLHSECAQERTGSQSTALKVFRRDAAWVEALALPAELLQARPNRLRFLMFTTPGRLGPSFD